MRRNNRMLLGPGGISVEFFLLLETKGDIKKTKKLYI